MIKEIWTIVPPERGQGELLSFQKRIRFISPISIIFEPFIYLGESNLSDKRLKDSFMLLDSLNIFNSFYESQGNLCLPYSLEGLDSFLTFFKEGSSIGKKGDFILGFNFSDKERLGENFNLKSSLSFHTFSLQKWNINLKGVDWIEWERKNIFYKKPSQKK